MALIGKKQKMKHTTRTKKSQKESIGEAAALTEPTASKPAVPRKRTLIERIIDPQRELRAAVDDETRLARVLFIWSKGAHAGQLLEITPKMIELATPHQRLQLAAILVEAGKLTDATYLAAKTYRNTPDLLSQVRYPALTLALSKMQPDIVADLEKEVEVLERYVQARDVFRDLILANKGSIAVVGNSPVLLEDEKGSEIDKHNIVIRFNNFQTGPKLRLSTGSKTTIWFRMPHLYSNWRRDRGGFDLTVLAGQGAFYRTHNAQDVMVDCDMRGVPYQIIPHAVYNALRQDHGIGAPSKGILCLKWLHEILGSLEEVSIHGFKMVDQGPAETNHYFDQGHPASKHPHDWENEYRALSALAPNGFLS